MALQIARTNMIKQQLRTGDVLDEVILALFEDIPRDLFVPEPFKPFAYSDLQIPLDHGQRMMTPLEEGQILQHMNFTGQEVVLEIGTGTGYFTALLSKLCQKVYSIDCHESFTQAAAEKLNAHECNNVELITGDGARGWLEFAPYDAIIFTGAIPKLTKTHLLQVLPGGQLFAVVGEPPAMQGQLHTLDHEEHWTHDIVFETELPLLVDKLKQKPFTF